MVEASEKSIDMETGISVGLLDEAMRLSKYIEELKIVQQRPINETVRGSMLPKSRYSSLIRKKYR
jgi:hypothetical protein